ncbi:MAG: hypothetical protein JWP85_1416 [Rhodoglobus sp.]|nr:hypothetical protein [Rhodoglobus sp.]
MTNEIGPVTITEVRTSSKRKLLLFATALMALVLPALLAPAAASATPPQQGTDVELLASGLQGASGGTIGPDGALYVTEGAIGEVTRIDPETGDASTFASGLPTSVIGIEGPVDVAFIGNTAYVLVSVVGPDVGGDQIDGIYRVDGPDSFTIIADLGAYSAANPPDTPFDLSHGVQFAFQPVKDGFLVTDGHHNRVLHVTSSGEITELIAFGNIVPTGLAVKGNTVYMAEAGPVPHAPADGKVVSFGLKSTSTVTDVASGFSLLTDVEFGKCNVLYALSQGDSPGEVPAGSPALPNSGELLRANSDGTFSVVVDGLDLPTSLDFVRDTAYVVTLAGEVWKISGVSSAYGCRDK